MCPKSEGMEVVCIVRTAEEEWATVRHFCQPRTHAESQAFINCLVWGLVSGILQHVPEGVRFDLRVQCKRLGFVPTDPPFTFPKAGGHPLNVFRGVFKWGHKLLKPGEES